MQSGALATVHTEELVAMIRNDYTDVHSCSTIGHAYANLLVIRCEHRESVTCRATVHRDHTDGTTEWIFEREIEFGPFDDRRTISNATQVLADDILSILQDIDASL